LKNTTGDNKKISYLNNVMGVLYLRGIEPGYVGAKNAKVTSFFKQSTTPEAYKNLAHCCIKGLGEFFNTDRRKRYEQAIAYYEMFLAIKSSKSVLRMLSILNHVLGNEDNAFYYQQRYELQSGKDLDLSKFSVLPPEIQEEDEKDQNEIKINEGPSSGSLVAEESKNWESKPVNVQETEKQMELLPEEGKESSEPWVDPFQVLKVDKNAYKVKHKKNQFLHDKGKNKIQNTNLFTVESESNKKQIQKLKDNKLWSKAIALANDYLSNLGQNSKGRARCEILKVFSGPNGEPLISMRLTAEERFVFYIKETNGRVQKNADGSYPIVILEGDYNH
jgi:hypothetical protein